MEGFDRPPVFSLTVGGQELFEYRAVEMLV